MRKIYIVLGLFIGFTSCEPDTQPIESIQTANASSSIETEDAVLRGWSRQGNCLFGYGNCAIAIESADQNKQKNLDENAINVKMFITEQNHLVILNKTNKKNQDGNFLEFDQDLKLPQSVSENLGEKSVTILEGRYETSFNEKNPYGVTEVLIK